MGERKGYVCPICGDPQPFILWVDKEPPPTCPDDPAWPRRSFHSICSRQLRKAEQAAELRRLTPDAFDANGVMIAGQSARAWRNFIEANPSRKIVL